MEGVPVYDPETFKKIMLGEFMHSVLYFGDEQYINSPTAAKWLPLYDLVHSVDNVHKV